MKKKYKKQNFLIRNFFESWDYILESKKYIYFVILLFFSFFLIGLILPTPTIFLEFMKTFVEELIKQTENLNTFNLIKFIFFNNLKVAFLSILFGLLFGLIPLVFTISNGYIIGVISKMVVKETGFFYLWRLLPHGIFELPAAIISFAIGIKLGFSFFNLNNHENIFKKIIKSLKVLLFIILPLLIIAAIIEGILINFFK